MNRRFSFFSFLALAFLCAGLLGSTPAAAGPYDRYYGDDDYNYERERTYDERRDLEREKARLREERDRLERERERIEDQQHAQRYQPAPEQCPPGFSPSENKCSSEERRRGCKDIRLPGGLGCVRR